MERLINLRDINSYLINLDESTDRLAKCSKLLHELNIKYSRFPGIKDSISVVGCGKSHLKLLNSLSSSSVIYEDDIQVTDDFTNLISVPSEADALYLGVSNHGYVGYNVGVRNTVKATQYNQNFKRVYNMCSTHAIVYLSNRYVEAAKQIIEFCITNNLPFDLGLAKIHKDLVILTPNKPMFFQEEQPEFTNLVLNT